MFSENAKLGVDECRDFTVSEELLVSITSLVDSPSLLFHPAILGKYFPLNEFYDFQIFKGKSEKVRGLSLTSSH